MSDDDAADKRYRAKAHDRQLYHMMDVCAGDVLRWLDELARLRAQVHRFQHDEDTEGDYACQPALEAQAEIERLRAVVAAADTLVAALEKYGHDYDGDFNCGACDDLIPPNANHREGCAYVAYLAARAEVPK